MIKKIMIAGMMAATALGAVAPAYAQNDGDRNGRWNRGGGQERGDGGNSPANRQDGWQRREAQPAPAPQASRPAPNIAVERQRGGDNNNARRDRNAPAPQVNNNVGTRWQGQRDVQANKQNNRRDDGRNDPRANRASGWPQAQARIEQNRRDDRNRWNRDWRQDNRYNWQSYRDHNRDRYRAGRYSAPYGWNRGYQSFSIGIYLGNAFYNDSYWIDDPYSYRLPPAYGSLRWVRYYDDALLVDVRNGYIVDVIHNFFW
ncbi:MAG: RcnB family protein [Sphingobium sp.]